MKQSEVKAASPEKISQIFGIPAGTLANMRSRKEGPRYFKRGRCVTYFISDFENWLKQNPVLTKDSI